MFPLVLYSHPPPPLSYAVSCLICGRQRVAVAGYRMICLVIVQDHMLDDNNSFTYEIKLVTKAKCDTKIPCWFMVYMSNMRDMYSKFKEKIPRENSYGTIFPPFLEFSNANISKTRPLTSYIFLFPKNLYEMK